MTTRTYFKVATALSAAGVLFSGYMSSVHYFTRACAFDEPCPMFLGVPACYFGFALFLTLLVLSGVGVFARVKSRRPILANVAVAAAGTAFAGSFAVKDLAAGLTTYPLGLSTCVYGAIFFLALLAVSILAWRNPKDSRTPTSGELLRSST